MKQEKLAWLVDHQGFGNGVHARAAAPRGPAGTEGSRDRRELHPQGAHRLDCRQRPGAAGVPDAKGGDKKGAAAPKADKKEAEKKK